MNDKNPSQRQDRPMAHYITLTDRKRLTVTGVEEVISFDEEHILLRSSQGVLTVQGSELHIEKLQVESSEVIAVGQIDGILYVDGGKKKQSKGRR